MYFYFVINYNIFWTHSLLYFFFGGHLLVLNMGDTEGDVLYYRSPDGSLRPFRDPGVIHRSADETGGIKRRTRQPSVVSGTTKIVYKPYPVYNSDYYDDYYYLLLFGLGIFFIFLIIVAILAVYVGPNNRFDGDDDDGGSALVQEAKRSILADPQDNKKKEAYDILKSSIRERNGKIPGRTASHEYDCPAGTVPTQGQYAYLSNVRCLPNYTWPVAVDETIINTNVSPCDSFSQYACSGWRGTGSRAFTFSSLTNAKVLRMVQNLDAIGDKLVWNPSSDKTFGRLQRPESPHVTPQESISTEREIFSTFAQTCHASLLDIPTDSALVQKSDLLSTMITSVEKINDNDWISLGRHYGASSCVGVSPLFHIRTESDIFDNSVPMFYVQPKGMIGVDVNSKKHEIYLEEACVHANNYLYDAYKPTIEKTEQLKEFWSNCYTLTSQLETSLSSLFDEIVNTPNYHGETMEESIVKYVTENKRMDKRKILEESGPFFTSLFFSGFVDGLSTCTGTDNNAYDSTIHATINRAINTYFDWGEEEGIPAPTRGSTLSRENLYIWVEYPKYFDGMYSIMEGSLEKPEKQTKETFHSLKMILMAGLAADNLEVSGYYAAFDFDQVTLTNGKYEPYHGHYDEEDVKANEKTFVFTPFVPFEDSSWIKEMDEQTQKVEQNPRIKRLKASGQHTVIRKKNMKNIVSVGTGEKEMHQVEPFSLSVDASWPNYAWFTCVDIATVYFPEIVDNSFASFTTTPEDRRTVAYIIDNLIYSLIDDMANSTLVDSKTKQVLQEKANNIAKRIAVPWETDDIAIGNSNNAGNKRYPVPVDHSEIGLEGKDFYLDTLRIRKWAMSREIRSYLDKIRFGRSMSNRAGSNSMHFQMSTSATNAFYNPMEQNINILAGIMKPPFYHPKYTPTSLYATIGTIIGHELAHSVDANSIYFDKYGNLNYSNLNKKEKNNYQNREQCFVEEYSNKKTLLGNNVNSEKTLSENIADNAGMQSAWDALKEYLKETKQKGEDITSELLKKTAQEFTLAYAQMWCTNSNTQEEQARIQIDVHSPPQVRVDRSLSNLIDKETNKYVMELAWGCSKKDGMVNKNRCAMW